MVDRGRELSLQGAAGARKIASPYRVSCPSGTIELAASMENATKQDPLERSVAAFGPAIMNLLAANATKPEYCSRAPGH